MIKKTSFILALLSVFLLNYAYAQEAGQTNVTEQVPPVFTSAVSLSKPADPNKISLDIKGMDVVDVLKMLATRSGMNIIVGKNVTGRVTLFLKEVDIWDAFEIILLANGLAYEKEGNIINVMTQRDYELIYGARYRDKTEARVIRLKYAKAADLSRALSQIKTNIGRIVVEEASNTLVLIDTPKKLEETQGIIENTDLPLQTKVFSLNYAQADKLSTKIQETVTKGVGSLKIDERTNKIAVTDYPERLQEIAKLIEAFDEKTPQVLIDAQIIEIRPSDKFEAGLDWDYWIDKNFRFMTSIPTAGALNKLSVGAATESAALTAGGQYKAIIDLLRTIGDTKILSSPRIMALNNQEAKILVGTREPYASQTTVTGEGGTVTTAETISFVDVGIKLYVTPTINKDNFVTMRIRPEISSAQDRYTTAKGEQIPIVATSEAETSVMLKDGVTIIIGGLRKDEKSETVKKIPILGDIPFLGIVFRNKSRELNKTELVILLTPHIMSGSTSFTDIAEIKPKDGVVAKMVKGDIITERIPAGATGKTAMPQAPLQIDFKNPREYSNFIWKKINKIATGYIGKEGVYKGRVQISFLLDSLGQVKDWPRVIFSTNHLLDIVAIKSIRDASPFPPFPEFLNKPEEVFTITFSYN